LPLVGMFLDVIGKEEYFENGKDDKELNSDDGP
jgi:hypothetical protein